MLEKDSTHELREIFTPVFKPEKKSFDLMMVVFPSILFMILMGISIFIYSHPIEKIKPVPLIPIIIIVYIIIIIVLIFSTFFMLKIKIDPPASKKNQNNSSNASAEKQDLKKYCYVALITHLVIGTLITITILITNIKIDLKYVLLLFSGLSVSTAIFFMFYLRLTNGWIIKNNS